MVALALPAEEQAQERCAGCRAPFFPGHERHCPAWWGDGEPDWGCQDCMLVWVGPKGSVCQRCFGDVIGSFW